MKPRVIVQVWCEMDPTLNLRVDRQTGTPLVEGGDVLMRVSPIGRMGIEAALKTPGAEVIAVALGAGHEPALRHALAAGASRAIEIRVNGSEECPPYLIWSWLQEQKPELVIMNRSAGWIASRLGWAHLAGLDLPRIENGRLNAIRRLGRGDSESVRAVLPAVVCLDADTTRVRYISAARISAVPDRAIERVELEATVTETKSVDIGPWQAARPRTRLGGAATPSAAPARAVDRLNALLGMGGPFATPKATVAATAKTPAEMAEEFVRYLRHHQLFN